MARGEVDRVQGAARVLTATRQYAKRQRTWMRNQLPAADVTVLDPRLPNALDRALEWWTADREGMG
jgi:tRNA A37 N6-isopentenylltransferase MiaA